MEVSVQISFPEKGSTEDVSQVSRDVDELLDMTGDDMADGPPKPKFRLSRLPMTSPTDARRDTAVVKRKCQRVMVAGLNTASGNVISQPRGLSQSIHRW